MAPGKFLRCSRSLPFRGSTVHLSGSGYCALSCIQPCREGLSLGFLGGVGYIERGVSFYPRCFVMENQPGRRGASSVGPPYHGRLGIYLPKMLAAASAEESFPSVTPFTIEPDFPELGKRELQIYARFAVCYPITGPIHPSSQQVDRNPARFPPSRWGATHFANITRGYQAIGNT